MVEEFYLTWSLFKVASSVVTLTCTMYCSRVGYFTQLPSSKVDNTKCQLLTINNHCYKMSTSH